MIEQIADMLTSRVIESRGIAARYALCGGPGRYEGLRPFAVWLCENVDNVADATTGDVEAPRGWVALCGRHVVTCDALGFWYVATFATRAEAAAIYAEAEAEYDAWSSDDIEGSYDADGRPW